MLSIAQSIILGAVEGLTEFLPVSSSGHLILARDLLGQNTSGGLAFDAILQLGTILAALLYFRTDVWQLIVTFFQVVRGKAKDVDPKEKTLLYSILVGTIPGVILGALLENAMENVFRSALIVACMLIAGSVLMLVAERRATQKHELTQTSQGWKIGWFQTLALIPGVSRSGATISGALLLGFTREAAARYSFLLSLPIITGAGAKKLLDVARHGGGADASMLALALGFTVSFAVGWLCIALLLKYLKTHTLRAFIWYRVALAAVVFAVLLFR